MNEAGINGEELSGGDSARASDLVARFFLPSWMAFARVASASLLPRVDFSGVLPEHNPLDGTGHVAVPSGFFRLVSFRLHGWRRSARQVADAGGDVAARQSNLYTRGSVTRPVVVRDGDVLRYYSLPPGVPAVVEEALHVQLHGGFPASDDGEVDVHESLVEALCHANAGMACRALGDAKTGEMLVERSNSLLPLMV